MRFEKFANLDAEKLRLCMEVDTECGLMRARFITTIQGQDMVYLQKRQEAELIVADPEMGDGISDALTPHVTSEAAKYGVTRFEKAVEILTVAQQWATISPLIETLRLSIKDQINAAGSVPAARAAAVIDWTALNG
jgi:hypothetical protein